MADLERFFVQFIHPGSEHGIHGSVKPWNTGEHRRKFLRTRGRYVKAPNAAAKRAELVFWGEWEPESEGEPIASPVPGGPRWLHRPFYVRPASYRNLQNTDPFVFGDRFLYTLCHQRKLTFLRGLAPGSLVLFGSLKGGEFVLDTALVVAEGVPHDFATWLTRLAGRISETYADVTMRPTYQRPRSLGCKSTVAPRMAMQRRPNAGRGAPRAARPHALRLYGGATLNQPFEGMFSFAPCLQASLAPAGFARPAIRLNKVITAGLMMGAKATRNLSVGRIKELWDAVVAQVLEQDLALGVRFDLPPRRSQ